MTMLDAMAVEGGFPDYAALAAHEPSAPGDPDADEVRRRLASTAALDPGRGSRTTARDCVRLLRAIWRDEAGPADACAQVRRLMARQLTRHRVAAGSRPARRPGRRQERRAERVVRNDIGVARLPDRSSYAVAAFTRSDPARRPDPRPIDAAIGAAAAHAVTLLQR
jgi:beta-lactamase class A